MKHLILCWGLLLSFQINAQEQLGLRLENYAGTSSLFLNPTGNLNNPLKWDLNLVGAGFFFENNYGYIRQTNVIHLLKNRDGAEFAVAPEMETQPSPNTFVIDFFKTDSKRFANFESYVDGPAFSIQIGEAHTVGVFTRFRSHGGTHDVPDQFGYYEYDALKFRELANIPPFDGAFMSWSEVGINYAVKIPTSSGNFSLGANVKRLKGYEAGFVQNFSTWDHIKVEKGTVSIGSPNGRFGFTDSNLTENGFEVTPNGAGFGLDLGAALTISEYEDFHTWRFGFSILDIGAIKFTENAQSHRVETTSTVILTDTDYEQFTSVEEVDEIIRLFSGQALGAPDASFQNDEFSMALPTAVSLQVDRSFSENVFLNATLVQRVSFGGIGPKRGNLLALTPRYEHRWFSASMPVALYNWSSPRIGFAARFGYLVIGSDDLGSFVGKGNLSGTDIYVALKFSPFETGWNIFGGGGIGSSKPRYGKRGKVKCYDF